MKKIIPLLLLTLLLGCSQGQGAKENSSKSINMEEEFEYSPIKSNVHPNAKDLMNEDFYFSAIDETGPFGSDDAADTYAGFAIWRKDNLNVNPEKYLKKHLSEWGYPSFDFTETDIDKLRPFLRQSDMHYRYLLGSDQSILAITFGQLYLEGKIDSNMLTLSESVLERHLTPIMLSVWPEDYQKEREAKLLKMKEVINKLKS